MRLREHCNLDKKKHDGEVLPYIGLEHIESGTGRIFGTIDTVEVKSSTFRFGPAHLLYGRLRPYLNKVLLPDFEGHCSTEIFPIQTSRSLDKKFLFYWLSWQPTVNKINRTSTGARMPRANIDEVLDFEIPLPPIAQQKCIVAILDEVFNGIDTAITNTEKNIANTQELFDSVSKSIIKDSNDWSKKKLSDLLELGWITSHLDGNHGSNYPRKAEFVADGIPYISANCLKNGSVDFSLSKFLTSERASSLSKGIAQDRDVLFAHNATVGPVAMLYTEKDKILLSTSLTYYRCNTEYIIPEYLAHYMRSPIFRNQYEIVMRQSTRNQVPITKQREFFHLIPPLDKQKEIAYKLDGLRQESQNLSANFNYKLSAFNELKQSLLQKAFAGELKAETEKEVEKTVS